MIVIIFPFVWATARRVVPFILFALVFHSFELVALARSLSETVESAAMAAAFMLLLMLWLRRPLWWVVRWARGHV
jgi:hypothetical protein